MAVLTETSISQPVRTRQPAGRRRLGLALSRVVLLLLLLGGWQLAVETGVGDEAFVSTPGQVLTALWDMLHTTELWLNLRTTVNEVLVAFVLSVVLGVASAIFLDRNHAVHAVVSPFLTALNSMPRIALGPLFILWFGIGLSSKIVLATSLGYFIVLLAMMGGLKNVDRDMLLMSRLYGASGRRLFWHVRLPWSLPSLFAGLRLTVVYCTSGAVIGEMIAAQSGLGVLLQTYSSQFSIANVLAVLIVIVAVVSLMTGVIELVERYLLKWSEGSTDVPG
jgi:ABC-type nitrate/sulfonate/bicarbonate transport system permease component